MSTFSWMSAPDISSNAAFRRWAKGIFDAFVGCGWVQTEDSGQLQESDFATLAVPTTTNGVAGYVIFRMNDVHQSACPIFIKFEFGRGNSASLNIPAIWITVGQGSNGAGAITGTLLARQQNYTGSSASGAVTEYPSYASCHGGGICLAPWVGFVDTAAFFFAIERSCDESGAYTADAVAIVMACSGLLKVRVIGNGGSPAGVLVADGQFCNVSLPATINGLDASTASTLSEDGVVAPVLPIPFMAPGVKPWVSNAMVAVHPGDAGSTSVIQAATINGQTRTYRAWTSFNQRTGVIRLASSSTNYVVPAIIWES